MLRINFTTWVFGDDIQPDTVVALGHLFEGEGTDESVTAMMKFGSRQVVEDQGDVEMLPESGQEKF